MKNYNEALECYNKALDINPRYAEAWYNKGNVYSIMEKYDEASKCFMIALSLFIINQEHIELIPKLLNFIIKNSKDEVIKAEARAIGITLLYLSKYLPKEEYIKKLNSLKKTPRIEVLIDAIINKKDTPMEIKDVVDEAFDLLKKQVLRSI
jgi:tetratricopeptide (TPR) repeat protein